MKRSTANVVLILFGLALGTLPGETGNAAGREVYRAKCAPCHGEDGRGNGPDAPQLHPKPRDFTTGTYEYRTTESGSIPTDEDLLRTVKEGLPGTSMPGWGPVLGVDSLRAVINYIKEFSPRFANEVPKPVKAPPTVPASASSIAAGKKVYEQLSCGACHGSDGRGSGAVTSGLETDTGEPLDAADLTMPWTFRGGATARDISLRFRTGLDGTPMPSYAGSATDRQMGDLANYVLSLARKPAWEMSAQELEDFYREQSARAKADPATWGRYLVRSAGCADCHTPLKPDGNPDGELMFAGGQEWSLGPYGTMVSYNLTSDSATGLGGWTDEQIKSVLTTGVRPDGSRMLPFPMPWTGYGNWKPEDLNAIVAYLRTIPPVSNRIPPPKDRNIIAYLVGKFRMLILKEDLAAQVRPGNAGTRATAGGAVGIQNVHGKEASE